MGAGPLEEAGVEERVNEVPMLTPDHVPSPVVAPEQMAAVDSSPSVMRPIPGSRMFEIRDALAVYRRANPDGTMFDASLTFTQ